LRSELVGFPSMRWYHGGITGNFQFQSHNRRHTVLRRGIGDESSGQGFL